ncbi:MAG TPA: hypothetical protein VGD62_08675 [Acidobacteriaceae bacterium]
MPANEGDDLDQGDKQEQGEDQRVSAGPGTRYRGSLRRGRMGRSIRRSVKGGSQSGSGPLRPE